MSKKNTLSLIAVILAIVLISIAVLKTPPREIVVTDLPWKINSENPQQTHVFSLNVGKDNLATVTESIKKIPQIAVFKNTDGSYLIESYFSKVKRGPLRGSFAVDVDITGVDIASYARFNKPGKPMPSGKRKYIISKTGIVNANQLRVWKIAYLPTIDYSMDQLLRFFGEPKSKKTVNASIENWLYPDKGLVITYDTENREVFYYSSRDEFMRLEQSIAKQLGNSTPTKPSTQQPAKASPEKAHE